MLILWDDNRLRAIAIIGTKGVGKTRLCETIFNKEEEQSDNESDGAGVPQGGCDGAEHWCCGPVSLMYYSCRLKCMSPHVKWVSYSSSSIAESWGLRSSIGSVVDPIDDAVGRIPVPTLVDGTSGRKKGCSPLVLAGRSIRLSSRRVILQQRASLRWSSSPLVRFIAGRLQEDKPVAAQDMVTFPAAA